MRKVSRRPRLELRQKQSLSIKQKIRLTLIITSSIIIPVFIVGLIYMNTGTAGDAFAHSTYTWKGNTSDDFSVPSNWNPNGTPGLGDKIVINSGAGTNWPKLYSDITIEELDINLGQLDLGGFELTITSEAKLKSSTIINGDIVANSFEKLESCSITEVDFEKTGSDDDESKGSNTFNGELVFINSSTGDWALAKDNGDTFNDNVVFKQTSSGVLKPARKGVSVFKGNISTSGTTTAITFGTDGGTVSCEGDTLQTLNGDAGYSPVIKKLTINNNGNGLSLEVPLRISTTLTLTDGIIYTDAVNLLTIGNGVSSVSGTSDSSYIEGPLSKIGNQAFTFPVGKNGKLKPIRMSGPSSSSAQFTAEYIYGNPALATGNTIDAVLNHISNYEYWIFNRIASTSNVKVTLTWTNSSGTITSLSELKIARWDASSSTWKSGGTVSTTGNTTTGTITTSSNMTSFGYFTLGSGSSANPLPVELISFNVEVNRNQAVLKWITASEKDNDYFAVERSIDGKNYEVIGSVRGAGTSSVQVSYEFKDEDPLTGNSYYRLKQTDFNGQFEYFGPRVFKLSASEVEFKLMNASPNPFSDHLKINYQCKEETQATLKIFRINGEEIKAENVILEGGVSSLSIADAASLNPGIYILTISNETKILGSVRVVKR